MGLVASKVLFDGGVPSLAEIAAAVERRTGLHCRIAADSNGFITVRCREFFTDIDLRLEGRVVSLEQPIAASVYFFDELREALVDLGGQRCNLGATPLPDANVPTTPVRWRDRKWTLRAMDRHPVLTSLLWMAIVVPEAIYRRLFSARRR